MLVPRSTSTLNDHPLLLLQNKLSENLQPNVNRLPVLSRLCRVQRLVGEACVDTEVRTDPESSDFAGSTLAQALNTRGGVTRAEFTDDSNSVEATRPKDPSVIPSLRVTSRALIKEYFTQNETVRLIQGHPTIAFSEDQISSVLRVVADETARASFDMLENLIQRASELHLGPKPSSKKTSKRTPSTKSSVGSSRYASGDKHAGDYSDTSGALRSDDNFSSIGYSFEHSEPENIASPPIAGASTGCRPTNLRSTGNLQADSPGSQTLASLKLEALKDRYRQPRIQQGRHTIKAKTSGSRRKITRSCKIMKDAYFKGMEWTKTFVSGPVDPRWNPYKFYCQIWKANISIYGKGAREILRGRSVNFYLNMAISTS